jgi:hypothetical protein
MPASDRGRLVRMTSPRLLLCSVLDRVHAHILANALEGSGIASVVAGGNSAVASTHRAYMEKFTEIWVLREDAERARRVLAAFRSGPHEQRGPSKPWLCPRCRETIEADFDLCWSCGAARPEKP